MIESGGEKYHLPEYIGVTHNPDPNAPKKIYVEVGGGASPAIRSQYREVFDNETFVLVEIQRDKMEEGIAISKFDKRDTLVKSMVGDFTNIPTKTTEEKNGDAVDLLKNENVDEIIFNNVWGDPSVGYDNIIKFLRQGFLLLKPGGKIVITETNTPNIFFDNLEYALGVNKDKYRPERYESLESENLEEKVKRLLEGLFAKADLANKFEVMFNRKPENIVKYSSGWSPEMLSRYSFQVEIIKR